MLRAERPRLNQLCNELESLPDFERVRDGLESIADLPSDTIEAIADLLEPLLADLPSAENAEDAPLNHFPQLLVQQLGPSPRIQELAGAARPLPRSEVRPDEESLHRRRRVPPRKHRR